MPIANVFFIIEVFTPFNQVVDLVIEFIVLQVQETLVIEGVLIELL
jgi:hypothetical protein